MDAVEKILLFLHLVGFGMLFGGAIVQVRDQTKVVNKTMLQGSLVQIGTGLLLVGVIEGRNEPLDHTKIAVKFVVALVVALLCWVNRRKESIPSGLFMAILLLTLVNVAVAVSL